MSLSVIAAAAAAVVGGTGAFFSDSETSTGNTFTAGAIDLKVDSQQHYNNAVCVPKPDTEGEYWWQLAPGVQEEDVNQYPVIGDECGGTWDETDLTNHKFFNFGDVKPGDRGENTISLHVINNDAYVCATVSNLANLDNDETEPEALVDDSIDVNAGELGQYLHMKIWADNSENTAEVGGWEKGDNVWQDGEPVLYEGVAQAGTWPLYSPATTALEAGDTGYLGVEWSLPTETGNVVQTDSLTGDISFRVEQARNNPQFTCESRS